MLIGFLIFAALLIVFEVAAAVYGVDSRDGRDWRPNW
jgi:hypothetical protein